MTPIEHAASRNRLRARHEEILAWLRDSEDSIEMLQIIRHGTARHLSDLLHRLHLMIENRFLTVVEEGQAVLDRRAGGRKWDLPAIAAKAAELRTQALLSGAIEHADRAIVSFDPAQVTKAIEHVETLIAFIREYIELVEAKLFRLADSVAALDAGYRAA